MTLQASTRQHQSTAVALHKGIVMENWLSKEAMYLIGMQL